MTSCCHLLRQWAKCGTLVHSSRFTPGVSKGLLARLMSNSKDADSTTHTNSSLHLWMLCTKNSTFDRQSHTLKLQTSARTSRLLMTSSGQTFYAATGVSWCSSFMDRWSVWSRARFVNARVSITKPSPIYQCQSLTRIRFSCQSSLTRFHLSWLPSSDNTWTSNTKWLWTTTANSCLNQMTIVTFCHLCIGAKVSLWWTRRMNLLPRSPSESAPFLSTWWLTKERLLANCSRWSEKCVVSTL